jgi:CheY-like chemotaxis protein
VGTQAEQFILALRLALQHAASQKGRSQAGKHLPQNPPALRILLAEDNPVNQQAASIMLGQWGHKVQAAGTGEEALALLAQQDFDLVLMDLEMPGMNGIEATARIRRQEQPGGKHTPIIAMTAHALDGDQQRCLQAGMDGYASKPFRPDELRRLILDVCAGGAPPAGRPSPPPASPEAPWDPSEAARLADGNRETVALIVSTFLKDLRQTLPAARQAAWARDRQALGALAHRWKGSLGLLGARQGVACAKQLEEACRSPDVATIQAAFEQLQTALLAVEAALSAWDRSNTPCKSS